MASCPWGEMSMGRAVRGAKCLWGEMSVGELSVGRNVRGARCPWGELSVRRTVVGRVVLGRVVLGRVVLGRVVGEPSLFISLPDDSEPRNRQMWMESWKSAADCEPCSSLVIWRPKYIKEISEGTHQSLS